jgi:hypothetical protein
MGAPIPPTPAVPPPQVGVTVSLDSIYNLAVATHEKVATLVNLPAQVEGLEKRTRSLENWRLALVSVATVSSGTAVASLFQLPILNK